MGSRNQRHETAMDQYFNEFVPMLEEAIREDLIDDDDPTIDLDRLQVARQAPERMDQHHHHHHHHPHNRQQHPQQKLQQPKSVKGNGPNKTFEMAVKDESCSLDGLRDITEHLKRGSLYGDKLVRIMLEGLEKSVSPGFFSVIVEQGVPPAWLPIVKRNNEDTPYIEFLIKNDKSDEEPFSQIADYSLEHLALSKYVLDQMLKSVRGSNQQNQPPDLWQTPPGRPITSASQHAAAKQQKIQQQRQQQFKSHHQQQPPTQSQQQPVQQQPPAQKPQEQPQQLAKKRVLANDKNKRSSLPSMTTSTPIRQRQAAVVKRASAIPVSRPPDESLNDSKRVLPPRACKLPVDGTYSKYVQ